MDKPFKFKTTADIKTSNNLIDQVIGQEHAVEIIKKAALQRRHILLIGEPGTGKSMLGMGLASLLPKEKLVDVVAFPNPNDENQPIIKAVHSGQGRDLVNNARLEFSGAFRHQNLVMFVLLALAMIVPWWAFNYYSKLNPLLGGLMFVALFLGGMVFLASFVLFLNFSKRMDNRSRVPKVIVDNYKRDQVPFLDATGAHAGALLGDVLHDPFQSFLSSNNIQFIDGKRRTKKAELGRAAEKLFSENSRYILKKNPKNYEAIYLPKNELFILGETHGSVSPVEVLSSNRYDYDGTMIKLITSENKELIVTPEHKIAIWKNSKISYIEAKDIREGDEVVAKAEDIIIDEQDIINTYDERQQKLAKSYYDYLELKKQNPQWGYKRIATKLGVSYGRIRWWWDNKSAPVPVQTVEWLKEKRLLPLKTDNPKLPLVAKVLGSTFGDGGIFENLNGIFLSSSNVKDTEEFSRDLQNIFGSDVFLNAEIREGGEFGHSWCMMNTNRNIIRFFIALDAPIGNKTVKKLSIPIWIKFNKPIEDEFYGSLFGGELGVSSYSKSPRIEFAITGRKNLEENRIRFLNEIIHYLNRNFIEITKRNVDITMVTTKKGHPDNRRYRFILSQSQSNIMAFIEKVKINYCNLKKYKLLTALDKDMKDKLLKYLDLRAKGLGAESIMKRLEIDPKYLYKILNNIKIQIEELKATP